MATDASPIHQAHENGESDHRQLVRDLIPTLTMLEKLDFIEQLTRSIRTHEEANRSPEEDEERIRRQHQNLLEFIEELEAEHAGRESHRAQKQDMIDLMTQLEARHPASEPLSVT